MERYDEISDIVLNILKVDPSDISIVDLAERTNIHRNVLAKYLKVLEAQGKVEIIREGSKKFIRISNRIPTSFLNNFIPFPYVIFDRYINIVEVSHDARVLYYPEEDDDLLPSLTRTPS